MASGAQTGASLLVVDDDPALLSTLERLFRVDGYAVTTAVDGVEALLALRHGGFDVVILDVSMPRIDGLEVCRRLRRDRDRTPVLMLTARAAIEDRVEGLDVGADDYLVKPFASEELRARVRALLRRSIDEAVEDDVLRFADLELDLARMRARRGERPLTLTRTEQRLLELFMRNPEQVLPRELIYERVWGYDLSLSSNSLDVYVSYLRRKTEQGGEPRLVQTIRGVGFMLSAS